MAKAAEPGLDEAPSRDFRTVSLPAALIDRAEQLARKYPILGYTNKSGFVTEALRRWLEREEDRLLALGGIYGKGADVSPPTPKDWSFPARRRE